MRDVFYLLIILSFSADEDTSHLDPPPDGWQKQSPTPTTQEVEEEEGEGPLSLSDSDLMCGLLEVMVILWEVAKDQLAKPKHQKVQKNLLSKVALSLPTLFKTFTVSPS